MTRNCTFCGRFVSPEYTTEDLAKIRDEAAGAAHSLSISKIKELDDEVLRLKQDNHALKVMLERALNKNKGDD